MSATAAQNTTLSIIDQLSDIQASLTLGGLTGRLIMTDDIKDYKKLREKAIAGKQPFYFGLAVPEYIQTQIDTLVRQHKAELLQELLNAQLEDLQGLQLAVTFDQDQDAYLVMLTSCSMGFYVSARQTRPRRRQNKPAKTDQRQTQRPEKTSVAKEPVVTLADVQAQVKKVEPKAVRPTANGTAQAGKTQKKQPPAKRRAFTVIRTIQS